MDRGHSPGLGPRPDSASRVQKPETAADKMAALKARVAAAIGSSKAKGGLNVGLHPMLEELNKPKSSVKASDSRSSSLSSNRATGTKYGHRNSESGAGAGLGDRQSNPYLDTVATGGQSTKQREPRHLVFNQKGKYIAQGNALRRQAALEAMKKRIAEQTRKTGIDEDLDVPVTFIEEPPDIEWWDEGLVDGQNYDRIEDESTLRITSDDSIITELIQHPVALEPPQDKNVQAPKPMFLTAKEQKKLRRQRRAADLKEKQAKVRLGLLPPEPPKITRNNMMVVLADQAVKDPTAVEAQVNREVAKRHEGHLQANEERKLTKEQRHEKLAANQEKDASKGLHLLVFKINSLANGQHRYKIAVNAEQHALTGICIMHPRFSIVIVEGGAWSIAKYKKLMLNRINWTENTPSRDRDSAKAGVSRDWLKPEDDKGGLKDMSANQCKLVFEGEVKTRAFRKWGSKVCETDAEARDVLARVKMENFWAQARTVT
ncbi:hypothetical protein MCOR27_011112 [Pyricularia oryzae]|uniref:Uncharacterized protein n=2 Tax=Pyricularia TaxID=48558 RepID=A0ABQ8N571_PYRGI|nr:hypothetical protein MCOR01_006887 [Pyricularia oryzae]KAI6291124.1 hypothetical protein MCOR33_010828 [Pyricularia grisea]KAH9434556.1 hypothetical protein MCOR02_006553 [Pyricularia oryzae]KAI6254695.1 hypothetical protein MCOR19_008806 [Pyricularia oryzae]KAI6266214.1 hypothetical protein MCOR27_011112 [Pyricularia oryzae]